jgi:hypothetical protein
LVGLPIPDREQVGRTLRALEVYGINSLKTQEPPLSSLAAIEFSGGTVLTLKAGGRDVIVDLQRVAIAEAHPELDSWRFGQGPQPTVRLLFSDGSGLDLKEPSKTKRISVRLLSVP